MDEKLHLGENVTMLLDAIYKLNEIDKSIMLLYLEEKSYMEISEILGITTSNVGVRINRAKETLKQNLNHLNYASAFPVACCGVSEHKINIQLIDDSSQQSCEENQSWKIMGFRISGKALIQGSI